MSEQTTRDLKSVRRAVDLFQADLQALILKANQDCWPVPVRNSLEMLQLKVVLTGETLTDFLP